MHFLRLAAAFIVSMVMRHAVADNCHGSSECHWSHEEADMKFAVDSIYDNDYYEPGQRIACIPISPHALGLAQPDWWDPGYCIFPQQGAWARGFQIKEAYRKLRSKCKRCGSVDIPGGELTFNFVAKYNDIQCWFLESGNGRCATWGDMKRVDQRADDDLEDGMTPHKRRDIVHHGFVNRTAEYPDAYPDIRASSLEELLSLAAK